MVDIWQDDNGTWRDKDGYDVTDFMSEYSSYRSHVISDYLIESIWKLQYKRQKGVVSDVASEEMIHAIVDAIGDTFAGIRSNDCRQRIARDVRERIATLLREFDVPDRGAWIDPLPAIIGGSDEAA
jgi:hypothetical protein